MKAIVISQPGGPDALVVAERPVPVPANHEILIQVKAAGVNRPDIAQRKGHYPPPPGASPDIPGLEVAGIVVEVGKDCRRFNPGDKVCALLTGGGYAAYAVAPEGQCLPVPGNLSFAEAASLPETYFTVWSNVMDRAGLQPGETLFVHGGSSGIGVASIQMATVRGSKVYVSAGSDEKCDFCERLGAAKAINYRTHPFEEVMWNLTGKKGVDVILDMVGGDYTSRNLSMLAEDGRLVMINFMGGEMSTIPLGLVMRRRLTITGSTLRARDSAFKGAIAAKLEKEIWPLLASGKMLPMVYATLPLSDAAKAHQMMESGMHMGKIMLVI